MKNLIIFLALSFSFVSCYKDLDLESYRGESTIVINCIANTENVIMADISKTWFYTDTKPSETLKDLCVKVDINGVCVDTMVFKDGKYVSDVCPRTGDTVRVSTICEGKEVSSTDIIPSKIRIDSVSVKHVLTDIKDWSDGSEYNHEISYLINITDPGEEDNYYFVSFSPMYGCWELGNMDYSLDNVFRVTSKRVNGGIEQLHINDCEGYPFTDEGIDGQSHQLVIKESGSNNCYDAGHACWRKIKLYSITKAYYSYLISIMSNDKEESTYGSLAQIGLAEHMKVYSNIQGGVGIFGCIQCDSAKVNVAYQGKK